MIFYEIIGSGAVHTADNVE